MQGASVSKWWFALGWLAARCLVVLVVSLALGANGCLLGVAVAQSNATGSNRPISFEIPAQPLDQALDAFGATTGLQIFYENSLTVGRRSSAVRGALEPQRALGMLLAGSGLTAQVIAPGTISVTPPHEAAAAPQPTRQAELAYRPYYGQLQRDVMSALCSRAETRPGSYHIALQYWIDPAGRVARLKLIGSSGSEVRDTAIIAALQRIVLPPPADMPQPVTMAIEPTGQFGCASDEADMPRVP